MGILVEDSELDNLYEEWEETLPVHGLSWEIYVARIQLKNVVEWLIEKNRNNTQYDKRLSLAEEDWKELQKEAGIE